MKTIMIFAFMALFLLAGCVEDQLDVTKETGSTQGELAQFTLTMSPESPKAQEQTTFSLTLPTGFTAQGFSCGVEDQDNQQEERCGDFDHDDDITQNDIDYLTAYMFTGGAAPNPIHIANVNGEDQVDISDLLYLIDFLHNDGTELDCQALENQPGIQFRAYEEQYYCVDVVADKRFDEKDLNKLVAYIFEGGAYPGVRADFNHDGQIDISDIVSLTDFIYSQGNAPSCPVIDNKPDNDEPMKSAGQDDGTGIPDDEVMADATDTKDTALLCGDLNEDNFVNEKDLQYLSSYMFTGGQAPSDMLLANVDGKGMVDISDLVYFINYIHNDGSSLTCAQPIEGSYNGIGRVADCGDVQENGIVDSGDVNFLVSYMFEEGPAPTPLSEGDVDGDGQIDISDLLMIIDFVYDDGSDFICQNETNTTEVISEGIVVKQDCGDATEDGLVSDEDVYYLSDYMFDGGLVPNPKWKSDVNSDGQIDISDLTALTNFIFAETGTLTCIDPEEIPENVPEEENLLIDLPGEEVLPEDVISEEDVPEEENLPVDLPGEEVLPEQVKPDELPIVKDICADLNKDEVVDESDLTYLSNYMFEGGPAPSPLWTADITSDGQVDISDLTYFVEYIHENGLVPNCPEPQVPTKELIYSFKDDSSSMVGSALKGLLSDCSLNGGCKEPVSVCGDVNGDTIIDAKDYQYLSNYMFLNGPAPQPLWGADVDGSGELDISDLVFLVTNVEHDGPTPSCDGNPQVEIDASNQCGDINGDGFIDSKDIKYLSGYLLEDGALPVAPANGDTDGDNMVSITDLTYLVKFLYDDGSTPVCTTQAQLTMTAKTVSAETLSFVCRYPVPGSYSATLQYVDAGVVKTLAKTFSVS